jgi:branched-chain amino acid transport system ATP-binding protein
VTAILRVEEVSLAFQGVLALDNISLDVAPAVIHGLVGPNGAGKTSLLNVISGVVGQDRGRVFFQDREISRVPLYRRIRLGIGRTFQGVELIADLTVLENMLIGRHHLMRAGVLTGGLFIGRARREEIRHRRAVEEAIEFFELERYRRSRVGDLSFGVQKLVGMARAVCSEPRLLLLDEVASGLNPQEKEDLSRFVLRIKHTRDITIVWVEHDMRMIAQLADTVTVLDYGRVVAHGTPDKVLRDPEVQRVFLGTAGGPVLPDPEQAAEG